MENKVILIVDDDERIVRMFRRRLKKIGLDIHAAANGKLGLEMATELQPDMILMDIRMPVMDGYEMVGLLRETGYDRLIVACTASVRAEDTESTIKAGCDYFIAKPVGNDFEEIVQKLLKEYN